MAALVLTLIGTIGLTLSLTRTPAWYRPVPVGGDELESVRRGLESLIAQFDDALRRSEPFEIMIDQRVLSRWLAAREHIWPGIQRYVPSGVRWPVVAFESGRCRIGGLVTRGRVESVISAALVLSVQEDHIHVRLRDVRIGAAPVPAGVIRRGLDAGMDGRLVLDANKASDVFDGVIIENTFTWRNGRRRFHVEKIELSAGRFVARIVPDHGLQLSAMFR